MTLLKEIRYIYDVLGRRVKRQLIDHQNSQNNRLAKFAFDGDRPIIEYDQNNSVVAVNDFSPLSSQDILARKLGSETYYYFTDSIGSVTDLVNSQGDIVERYRYSSFGVGIKSVDYQNQEIPITQQIDNPFKYIAREWDSDAGLLYLRARYYDPTIGRFFSQDPHPGVMTNHLTVANKYIYSSNNPINLSDPDGLFGKFFKKLWNSAKKRKKRIIGLAISTLVGGPLGQLAYINLSGEFHENDVKAINAAVIVAAAAATGGAAGGAAVSSLGVGAGAGVAIGFVVGAVVGGVVGGVGFELAGVGTFKQGFIQGAIAGGLAGMQSGYEQGRFNDLTRAPSLDGAPIVSDSSFDCMHIGKVVLIIAVIVGAIIYKYNRSKQSDLYEKNQDINDLEKDLEKSNKPESNYSGGECGAT